MALPVKSYNHFLAYPFIHEIVSLFLSFSLIAWIATHLSQAIEVVAAYLSKVEFVVHYWTIADNAMDTVLGTIDKKYPKVAKFSFLEFISFLKNSYKEYYDSLFKKATEFYHATDPTRRQINSKLEPIFKIANDYYEYLLDIILPYAQELSNDSETTKKEIYNEYHRMLQLWISTYDRLQNISSTIAGLPSHVSDVYAKEFEQANGTTDAVTKATRKLSSEAYDTIKPTLDRFVPVVKSDTVGPIPDDANNLQETVMTTGIEVH